MARNVWIVFVTNVVGDRQIADNEMMMMGILTADDPTHRARTEFGGADW
jgi:hypothetical protein